jgi:hypothetical protein
MESLLSDIYSNPGKQLQLVVKDLYPVGATQRTFITRIDDALLGEGQFTDLVYLSAINYMVRRLICTGEYLRRKFALEMGSTTLFIRKLRNFIWDELEVPKNSAEKLVSLVLLCVEERTRNITPNRKHRLFVEAQAKGWRCFFCGCDLEFVRSGQPNSATADHLWPRSMGGKSEAPNLVVACRSCNEAKADYIDASDFHFEEMCLVTDKEDEQFGTDFKRQYRMAMLAAANYRCSVCEIPASFVGELVLSRLVTNDSWHFLNVGAYCAQHDPN